MKVISYWETAPGRTMPTYIPLCIASMQTALGDSFLLLTNENTRKYIGEDYLNKKWIFDKYNSNLIPEIASIVAKTDFIRMSYVNLHGGFWLDADTIVLNNFLPFLQYGNVNKRLFWHSEQFFGANKGNDLLDLALKKVLDDKVQTWGNPGGIKSLIAANPEAIFKIPFKQIDPGYIPPYRYESCDVLVDKNIPVESFLINKDVNLLKVYNSEFCALDIAAMPLKDFLISGTLIARIFLKLNPSVDYWLEKVEGINTAIGNPV